MFWNARARWREMGGPGLNKSDAVIVAAQREMDEMRPGIWLVSSRGYARHWSVLRLPAFLRQTKMSKRTSGGVGPGAAGFFDSVMNAFLYVPRGPGRYSVLLPTKGGVLLMSPELGWILRVGVDRREVAITSDIRLQMSPFVKNPDFEVLEGGARLREQLVEGTHLGKLHPDVRLNVWRSIASEYAHLATAHARGRAVEIIEPALRFAEQLAGPTDLLDVLRRTARDLLIWAGEQPMVPSHGDLSDENIIVDPKGHPVVIDFEARCVGWLPFFHDPLLLAVREARRGRAAIVQRILNGEESEAISDLWSAAGTAARPDALMFALLGVVIVHVFRRNHHEGPPDLRKAEYQLTAMWKLLSTFYAQWHPKLGNRSSTFETRGG
jgi:hypothetical protein